MTTGTEDEMFTITGGNTAYENNSYRDPNGQVALDYTGSGPANIFLYAAGKQISDNSDPLSLDYGTLTVSTDGICSYVLNNDHPDVINLDGDDNDNDGAVGTLTESIRFTYVDIGSQSVRAAVLNYTLEIIIHGSTEPLFSGGTADFSDPRNEYYSDDLTIRLGDNYARGLIKGGSGNDWLYGADKKDWIYGNEGDDLLDGGDDHDRLDGGGGDDKLKGGDGHDRLYGGADDDTLMRNLMPSQRRSGRASILFDYVWCYKFFTRAKAVPAQGKSKKRGLQYRILLQTMGGLGQVKSLNTRKWLITDIFYRF